MQALARSIQDPLPRHPISADLQLRGPLTTTEAPHTYGAESGTIAYFARDLQATLKVCEGLEVLKSRYGDVPCDAVLNLSHTISVPWEFKSLHHLEIFIWIPKMVSR
ncbi:hypothetical protein BGX24_003309, partial [Mortierella sp. AD032]